MTAIYRRKLTYKLVLVGIILIAGWGLFDIGYDRGYSAAITGVPGTAQVQKPAQVELSNKTITAIALRVVQLQQEEKLRSTPPKMWDE